MEQPQAPSGLVTQQEAQEAVERVLSCCTADQAEVTCSGTFRATTRFANSAITQNLAKTEGSVSVKVAFGRRAGRASTSDFRPEALEEMVRRAESIARMSEEDPELMPPLPPQAYTSPPAYFPETEAMSPAERAEEVRRAAEACDRLAMRAAGSYTTEVDVEAVGTSAGLRGFHRATLARFVCTAIGPDSTGWAESASPDVRRVDAAEAADRAARKADLGRKPSTAVARPYTVVLEPAAVAELTQYFGWGMDAKQADEGTTAFSGLEGKRIGSELVTLRSDPADPRCPGWPFGEGGAALKPTTWIHRGVLQNLSYTRYWAEQQGRAFTGRPSNLLLEGGDASVEDLIAGVEDGLLVTRFWYIRYVEPKTLLLTGMTRDGLFRIQEGRVTGGVTNLRFNESPLRALRNVVAVGKPAACYESTPVLAPPLVITDFTFSSGTSF